MKEVEKRYTIYNPIAYVSPNKVKTEIKYYYYGEHSLPKAEKYLEKHPFSFCVEDEVLNAKRCERCGGLTLVGLLIYGLCPRCNSHLMSL